MQNFKQTHIIPLNRFWVFILSAVTFYIILPTLLDAQIDTAWVRRYNGPYNSSDYAIAIAVDNLGNVYVTGQSMGSSTGHDYATIKYYPNGDTAWVRRYNGPGNTSDGPNAIAVDASGYVYVTGYSVSSGINFDYATIKYYPNGDTAWVRRYNGPGNYFDYAHAIVVDNSYNVYVTGYSNGLGTGNDYATIKYYPNGDMAWVRRYNGPGNDNENAYAIAVDTSGKIYVTGWSTGSGTGNDYATIKYYPNGDTAWVRRYNVPWNNSDLAYAIAVDALGNTYITGYSTGSGTGRDYATIKYYPDGDTAWVRRFNGPGNDHDYAYAITADISGNAYVTGYITGTGMDYDYATIKYYPDGDTAWVRRYNGPGNGNDQAIAMTTDTSRNVYVTGYSFGSSTGWDYATIKYSPTGEVDENFSSRISVNRNLIIYPNPASNYITIRASSTASYSTNKIFDVSGKKIKEIKGMNSRNDNNISVSDIKPGVYFIQIDGKIMQKVIKVR